VQASTRQAIGWSWPNEIEDLLYFDHRHCSGGVVMALFGLARRRWLLGSVAALLTRAAHAESPGVLPDPIRRDRPLVWPRDHGAHPANRLEWWYATGWAGPLDAPTFGWQLTFFRSRTGLAQGNASRFAARHLLFAHAAITDLAGRRHLHDQRIARWNGDPSARPDSASLADADIRIGRWTLRRSGPVVPDRLGSVWQANLPAGSTTAPWGLELTLSETQPVLLQGEAGFSRKGPDLAQASHYASLPQLAMTGGLRLPGQREALAVSGRGWLDQEWSDTLLHPEAVGWDWIGMNLADGGALTAFVLRRADGSALWAGGSHRGPGVQQAQVFAADGVRFVPGRRWTSGATGARYPVQWTVHTPAGRFEVRALLDSQELDGRGGTGAVYWEGLSELLDAGGRRVGLGYLEMTGYNERLRLG
jgi:predicted secreted hydrolase